MMPAHMMQPGPSMYSGAQVPMMYSSLPPPPPPQPQQMQQQMEYRYDIMAKVKVQVWSLKEQLGNIMRAAGSNIYHNAVGRSSEEAPEKIDKILEDFFSTCNQIELHLKTLLECTMQQKEGIQYLPVAVVPGRSEAMSNQIQDGALSYIQYLSMVKTQVRFAKEVQQMLNEGATSISKVD